MTEWNAIVHEALAFSDFQWQVLTAHESHLKDKMRSKFQHTQRKLADECDDLRHENKLLAEKSRRIAIQMQKREKYCNRLENQVSTATREAQVVPRVQNQTTAADLMKTTRRPRSSLGCEVHVPLNVPLHVVNLLLKRRSKKCKI